MSINIVRKEKEIVINGEDYVMTFDMKSVILFKEMTGKSFLQSAAKIGQLDDESIIAFIGATTRPISAPNKPIGKLVYQMDLLNILQEHCWNVVEIVTASMPQSSGSTVKK